MQSRHALHDIQMNQIKAAASPMRKLSRNYDRAGSASPQSNPKTPRRAGGKENDLDDDVITVGGTAVTPMKRVPILANFEEWMKMATDNKINAANSWNFALIDYFHDMSLLKEGDGVNFQKASCTLDGCVKIYTSRVDSVATETGKLLSGLADSGNNKKKRGESEEGEESEEEIEDENGVVQKKPKKRVSFIFSQSLPTLYISYFHGNSQEDKTALYTVCSASSKASAGKRLESTYRLPACVHCRAVITYYTSEVQMDIYLI
jgi:condensin complex subunit 2